MIIVSTDQITIDTDPTVVPGGGTDNIGFLVGVFSGPNAIAARMSAIFWIETVQVQIEVGPLKAGDTAKVSPAVPLGASRTDIRRDIDLRRRRTANGHGDLPPDPVHPKRIAELRDPDLAARVGGNVGA